MIIRIKRLLKKSGLSGLQHSYLSLLLPDINVPSSDHPSHDFESLSLDFLSREAVSGQIACLIFIHFGQRNGVNNLSGLLSLFYLFGLRLGDGLFVGVFVTCWALLLILLMAG